MEELKSLYDKLTYKSQKRFKNHLLINTVEGIADMNVNGAIIILKLMLSSDSELKEHNRNGANI